MNNTIEIGRSYKVKVYETPHKIFVLSTRVNGNGIRQYRCMRMFGKNHSMWIDENSLKSKIVD